MKQVHKHYPNTSGHIRIPTAQEVGTVIGMMFVFWFAVMVMFMATVTIVRELF